MSAQELTLHIAANLGRVARFTLEGRPARIDQFLQETEGYLHELEAAPRSARFERTFGRFKEVFAELKRAATRDAGWAEEALTWASVLTHRAKLA